MDTTKKKSAQEKQLTKTFIQEKPVDFKFIPIQKDYNDWMVYMLLLLTFFISLIWYYLPERALSLIKFSDKPRDFRSRENVNTETPGTMILLFFIVNYFITFSLLLYLSVAKTEIMPTKIMRNEYLMFFVFAVVSFYIYRLIIIYITGFIFNTKDIAIKQIKLYVNVDNLTGVLLIPLLFLMLFTSFDFLFYVGISVLAVFQFFKWFQTFILGKSIPGFSMLHLFMYLCTLEIIPLIVLIKLFFTSIG